MTSAFSLPPSTATAGTAAPAPADTTSRRGVDLFGPRAYLDYSIATKKTTIAMFPSVCQYVA